MSGLVVNYNMRWEGGFHSDYISQKEELLFIHKFLLNPAKLLSKISSEFESIQPIDFQEINITDEATKQKKASLIRNDDGSFELTLAPAILNGLAYISYTKEGRPTNGKLADGTNLFFASELVDGKMRQLGIDEKTKATRLMYQADAGLNVLKDFMTYDSKNHVESATSYKENLPQQTDLYDEKEQLIHQKNYSSNGLPSEETHFKNGIKTATIVFAPDGYIANEFLYEDGLKQTFETFYPNGKTKSQLLYQNDIENYQRGLYEDGKLRYEIDFENGKQAYKKEFYPDGKLETITRFDSGKMVQKTVYETNHSKITEHTYKDGQLQAAVTSDNEGRLMVWDQYRENGNKRSRKLYLVPNDPENMLEIFYDPAGQIMDYNISINHKGMVISVDSIDLNSTVVSHPDYHQFLDGTQKWNVQLASHVFESNQNFIKGVFEIHKHLRQQYVQTIPENTPLPKSDSIGINGSGCNDFKPTEFFYNSKDLNAARISNKDGGYTEYYFLQDDAPPSLAVQFDAKGRIQSYENSLTPNDIFDKIFSLQHDNYKPLIAAVIKIELFDKAKMHKEIKTKAQKQQPQIPKAPPVHNEAASVETPKKRTYTRKGRS